VVTRYSRLADRSVPRAALKAGDASRDGRGRVRSTPPILHYGFRPFFFLAALHAGFAVPLWLCVYFGAIEIAGPFGGVHWHAHEMLFGYLAAVIAGFVLTAIPNWTGRLPLSGLPLAALVALWLAGRAACLLAPDPWLALTMDLAFPAVLASAIWREVIAGRNWKNAPVAVMITIFGAANGVDHLANAGLLDHDLGHDIGHRLALAVAAVLIALIGGRIVPSFTRNLLVKAGASSLPLPFGPLDKTALAATVISATAWLAFPETAPAGIALVTAGLMLAVRLSRWCGMATVSEPIVFILHVGYGWLSVALCLLGLSALTPAVPYSSAIHALTAGAIGTMTLAVMTRASLGHTGRVIVADRFVVAIYLFVTAGAVLRVAAPFADQWHIAVLAVGGSFWSGAFLLFVVRYTPILWVRRAGG
jgi:uncharacterized protein involved in response to NO